MTPEEADKAQQWAGMDGATAWHLIDRHAGNWNETGEMMNAWLRANARDGKLTDLLQAGAEAADVLRQEATILRDCHTLNGEWDLNDPEVKANYDRMMALADRLTPNAEVTGAATT